MNTALILGGCTAVLATMLGLLFADRPVDDEHTLEGSKRRPASSSVPTRGRRGHPPPYDWEKDP